MSAVTTYLVLWDYLIIYHEYFRSRALFIELHIDDGFGTDERFATNYFQGTLACRFKASRLKTFWSETVDLATVILVC